MQIVSLRRMVSVQLAMIAACVLNWSVAFADVHSKEDDFLSPAEAGRTLSEVVACERYLTRELINPHPTGGERMQRELNFLQCLSDRGAITEMCADFLRTEVSGNGSEACLGELLDTFSLQDGDNLYSSERWQVHTMVFQSAFSGGICSVRSTPCEALARKLANIFATHFIIGMYFRSDRADLFESGFLETIPRRSGAFVNLGRAIKRTVERAGVTPLFCDFTGILFWDWEIDLFKFPEMQDLDLSSECEGV